ncbi:DMT family transporter [Nitrospira lenta]|uniref:Putative Transporter, eamA family n=1 Tax=Nitrospira lenta TaxID=1436998 RepID=A0A330L8C5_9BACT|nr:DMT family transporter [Nitrospira lenta]SPP63186.1 putative Transporter, eamA family [Nitrospira lenta]
MPRFALLLTTLIWGATFPATKAALDQIPPLSFLFLRFLLGAVLVGLCLVLMARPVSVDRAVLRASAIATGWLFLGYVLQTVGLGYTTASNSAFITTLYVVFVPLILRRFGSRSWVAAGIATVGLWCLVKPTTSVNVGDLLTLGCALAFAAHMACLERYTRELDATSLFLWQLVAMSGLLFVAMVWEHPTVSAFEPTTVLLIGLAVTGVLATLAFAVQMWAQQLLAAQQVALIFSLEPAYAAWLAWYFLGESLDWLGWVGSGLILIAVIIGSLGASVPEADRPLQISPAA